MVAGFESPDPAPDAIVRGLHGEGQKRPLYSRFPSLYFSVPSWFKSLSRKLIALRRGDAAGLTSRYLSRITPGGLSAPVPLLLTHDIDTLEGFRNLDALLRIEESHGMASLNFLVTHRYPLDREQLKAWLLRGHRFGIHDTNHDNQIAYLPSSEVKRRIREARAALAGLDTGAFRAPAFLRSASLYEGLASEVRYDFSSNDWALAWPFPGDGMRTSLPRVHRGVTCVPTTLPRDGEMLALGLSSRQMRELTLRKIDQLASIGAPAVFLNHPDPGFTDSKEMLKGYSELLGEIKRSGKVMLLSPEDCLEALSGKATPI